ncbi:toll-like receptor Tollo [Mytilus californianus]|uniref:toll-like receptor Tollo n=1 Tax=Mytilus californianus TaxID=6549 RepID=UPI0022471126|nr:toll-like receptor Tollo [Mytilus californianus]
MEFSIGNVILSDGNNKGDVSAWPSCSDISIQTDFSEDSDIEWFDAEDMEKDDFIESSSDEEQFVDLTYNNISTLQPEKLNFSLLAIPQPSVAIFNKFGIRLLNEKHNENKLYNAFISYTHKYEGFVVHELVPRPEKMEGYKLCLHFWDFPVGACIAETIIQSVEESSRTVKIVSHNFLQSEWCHYEFQTSHHSVLKDRYKNIIIILMENINFSKLDPELKCYMKTRTYLKSQNPWFWEKVMFALPKRKDNHNVQIND